MKLRISSVNDFFLWIWSYLLKKSSFFVLRLIISDSAASLIIFPLQPTELLKACVCYSFTYHQKEALKTISKVLFI